MSTIGMLYKHKYQINDKISVVIPTVGEILEFGEDEYYSMVTMLTAMPVDLMVQLDDLGIDFTTINEYDLFVMLSAGMRNMDTRLLFGDLDFSKLQMASSRQNGLIVLRDEENDITIDRAIHGQISAVFRKIHHLERDRRKPANEEARKYMLERARTKMNRRKGKAQESQIEPLIVAMVNTEQYKYDYESTLGLTIYQFNESVRQIVKKVDYDNRMFGVYTGNLKADKLSQADLNWLTHK